MTAITPKGSCPSLFAPMASGDGLLVRVRPFGGVLRAVAARALAEAAARYGNGAIELTNRASLQVRGLRADTVAPFAAAIVAAGLACADPQAERRRNVIAAPLSGDDVSASRHGGEIALAIEAAQMREPRLSALHGKFGVLVDAGGVLPTGAAVADIRVVLHPFPYSHPQGEGALVALDGSDLAVICAPLQAADAVLRLALAFLDISARCETPPRRMRDLVAQVGARTVFAAAGLTQTATMSLAPTPTAVGWLPYPGTARGAFGVGLPFGSTVSPTLSALADAAKKFGDGTLRLTPWRAFAIPGVTAPDAVHETLAGLDATLAKRDTRARISACPGRPACANATVPTRADAERLAAAGFAGTIHVSGCVKGCAHPAAADVTLVGHAGTYALVRHGRAGDAPTRTGLTIEDVLGALGTDRERVLA